MAVLGAAVSRALSPDPRAISGFAVAFTDGAEVTLFAFDVVLHAVGAGFVQVAFCDHNVDLCVRLVF